MNPTSLTGLLVVIAAAVWVCILIPAWTKKGFEGEEIRQARTQGLERIKAQHQPKNSAPKMVSIARISLRLSQLRMIFGFTMFGGLVTAVVALADAANLWPISAAGFLVALVSIAVTRRATKNHMQLLASSLANRNRFSQGTVSVPASGIANPAVSAEDQESGWIPVEIPAPLHAGHIGNLEQPILAQVKEFPIQNLEEVQNEPPQTMDIDEILRRRRDVG